MRDMLIWDNLPFGSREATFGGLSRRGISTAPCATRHCWAGVRLLRKRGPNRLGHKSPTAKKLPAVRKPYLSASEATLSAAGYVRRVDLFELRNQDRQMGSRDHVVAPFLIQKADAG